MHRGEFGGGLFAPDLPEPTAQQGDDFLLNLRIVQQTQERPFESLVLLRLLDLVFNFDSVLHGSIMPQGSSAERPVSTSKIRPRGNSRHPGLVRLAYFSVIAEYRRSADGGRTWDPGELNR